jgi:hypothetical protein
MSVTQVNVLNIGLMLASCVAAFVFPFRLFLLSYAVLGPLHYLTQISWLHTRGYFTSGKRDYVLLLGLCFCLLLCKYVFIDAYEIDARAWAVAAMLAAIAGAGGMAFGARPVVTAALMGGALLVAPWVATLDSVQIVVLTFLPTIIHVYCFTAAFILYGALRGRSVSGIASLVVFAACTASFFVYRPHPGNEAGEYVRSTYGLFSKLNVYLADWLGLPPLDGDTGVYTSQTGLMLMRLIAFAYTYHYLNWFSKTSVIQWHKIPRAWAIANVVLWLGAIALYVIDYRIGMVVLFSLSWLHVVLELPLDHRTFAGIGRELGAIVRRSPSAVPARSAQPSPSATS